MTGSLREVDWRISYGPADDRLNGFYVPALKRAIRYDRSSGFFNSSALAVAAAGVAHLIASGGHMRLLVGADLDESDVQAIANGTDLAACVSERLLQRLTDPQDEIVRDRHAALAWMVGEGMLEIRVVLPKGPDGLPLAASESIDYYHPKEGTLTDAAGDAIAFSGSVNESATGWLHNYEQFAVFRSWDATAAYVAVTRERFEKLWEARDPDWIAIAIPDAVRDRLLRLKPSQPPARDPLERPSAPEPLPSVAEPTAEEIAQERIAAQYIRDAARLPNGSGVGAETSAIVPWPHQTRVAEAIIDRFPERFLVADEVGLGKTIEAGLVLRQLLLSGRVERALVLTPKSVLRQWQEELYEKFALDVPRFDGSTFWGRFGDERPASTPNPFDTHTVVLASSQLMKRRERQAQLLEARPFDLLLVDEAHHARRKDFLQPDRHRPNRLLELLTAMKPRTRGVVLLTATPMQVHPVEIWDLLRLIGLGGRWGARDTNFLQYFTELRREPPDVDWDFLFGMLRDELRMGGAIDPAFEESARSRIGPVDWSRIKDAIEASRPGTILRKLPVAVQHVALELARQQTPLRRMVWRNTRALLREYQTRGILKEGVPTRDVRPEWVQMRSEDEERLYDRIEEYIAHFYARYEQQRVGLGFVMTVYRRRLTSSFYAVRRSLERRLAFLRGEVEPEASAGLVDDDLEQDDLDLDVSEAVAEEEEDRKVFRDEISYVEDFIRELRGLGTDSKLNQLLSDLRAILQQRETVMVYTQYTDTLDYLRDELRQVYGRQVGCYSGRGGEVWRDGEWRLTTKEEIKRDFALGEEIKILLCTEAASEGLNLQTCGVLINYDMPWNPMRVEQRIGRIDRIGQRHKQVWIRNYFYEGTIEALVYQRLSDRIDWFVNVVGELQPILSQVGRTIQQLALTPRDEREQRISTELERLRRDVEEKRLASLNLDEFVDPGLRQAPTSPIALPELEELLTQGPTHRGRFRSHPSIDRAYLLDWAGLEQAVTFDRSVFDAHPETVRFLVPGDRLFEALVADIDRPLADDSGQGVARGTHDWILPRVVYYEPKDGRPARVASLSRLADGTRTEHWAAAALEAAEQDLESIAGADIQHERRVEELIDSSERLALEERARDVLVRTAYVELAQGQQPELFGEQTAWQFSEDAIRGLKRHKYPFAPLLTVVDVSALEPTPTDAFFLSIQSEPADRLRRRFDDLRREAIDLVGRLAAHEERFGFPQPDVRLEVLGMHGTVREAGLAG